MAPINNKKNIKKNISVNNISKGAKERPTARKSLNTVSAKTNTSNIKRPVQSHANSQKTTAAVKKQQSREALNRRIQTQTPANRQAVRKVKKVNGSVKNIEIKRRQNTSKQKFYVKKKNKGLRRLMLMGLVIFLLLFLLMFGAVSACVAVSLNSNDKTTTGSAYTLQIGEKSQEDGGVVIDIPAGIARRNGSLYIPVSALSEYCSLTVTGLTNDLRYIVRESDGQSMRFIVGTDIAYANNVKVRLNAPTFISNGKLFVPLDFLSLYSKGLTIDIDENKRHITIIRNIIGKDEENNNILAEFKFKLSDLILPAMISEEIEEY